MFANGTAEANDGGNPYRDSNIGVEKLLELNSEENHDDVCLSYIFTYRDFADGVLGLAWVGEAGNKNFYIKGWLCDYSYASFYSAWLRYMLYMNVTP